jgi:hypothetical protein
VHRFILKAYYGIPLDSGDSRDIVIRDQFNDKTLQVLNEQEFLQWLVAEGRVNTSDLSGKRMNLALIVGQRGSKDTVIACIVCYELYKLLSLRSPQVYYRLYPNDLIQLSMVSSTPENSVLLHDRVAGYLERSPFFKGHLKGRVTRTGAKFKTVVDCGYNAVCGEDRSTVALKTLPRSARSLRGPNHIMYVMNGVAQMIAKSPVSNASGYAVQYALEPSMAMFSNPDGSPAGRGIMVSIPGGNKGLLWDTYERSLDHKRGSDLLMLNIPSWVLNPSIPPEFLKLKYRESPETYMTSYGGKFMECR